MIHLQCNNVVDVGGSVCSVLQYFENVIDDIFIFKIIT
jgi:hypothetical protein